MVNTLIWTLSQPFFAHTWWPCKDLPEDKADSVDVVITVPDGLTAVSNGVLRQTVENPDGTKTFFWHEGYPVPPYLVSLAVSGYDVRKDIFTTAGGDTMPVEFYVTPEKSGTAFGPGSAFPQTLDMLRVFSELFGNYPFLNEKYAQVEFGAGGGMEHQTATSLNVPPAGPNVFLVSHELAHQWWGDFITCRDWHHIWLNEGFATYSEGLYLESLGGKPALKDFMGSITAPPGEWGSVFRDNIDDVDDILTGVVFEKGAWVFHMLRSVVGDALFFEILRAYGSDPGLMYWTAVTEDFQAVAERVYGAGRPHYRLSWDTEKSGDLHKIRVTIDQIQQGIPFTMPLEIFVEMLDGKTEVVSVMHDVVSREYTITVQEEPVFVSLDDSNKVLKEVVLDNSKSPPDVPEIFTLFPNFPNPFNPATIIHFQTRRTTGVTVKVYSVTGSEIKTIVNRRLTPGIYRVPWDGTNSSGTPVGGGIYFVRMTAENFVDVNKMVLIK